MQMQILKGNIEKVSSYYFTSKHLERFVRFLRMLNVCMNKYRTELSLIDYMSIDIKIVVLRNYNLLVDLSCLIYNIVACDPV